MWCGPDHPRTEQVLKWFERFGFMDDVWCSDRVLCSSGVQAFNFITALNPFGPTFDEDNQADVRKRPAGPTQKAMDPSKPAVRPQCSSSHMSAVANTFTCISTVFTYACVYALHNIPHAWLGGNLLLFCYVSEVNDTISFMVQEYFGTSKAFGFTKKNELFVGRVAMLVCPCQIIF